MSAFGRVHDWLTAALSGGLALAIGGVLKVLEHFQVALPDWVWTAYGIGCAIAVAVCAAALIHGTWRWIRSGAATPTTAEGAPHVGPPTLEEFFRGDFTSMLRIDSKYTARLKSVEVDFRLAALLEGTSHTESLAVYIPETTSTVTLCEAASLQAPEWLADIKSRVQVSAGLNGDVSSTTFDWQFSRTVYIYHVTRLDIHEASSLIRLFADNGLLLILRGTDYQVSRWMAIAGAGDKDPRDQMATLDHEAAGYGPSSLLDTAPGTRP